MTSCQTVLTKYPDAIVKETIDKTSGETYYYIWGGNMLIGTGDTAAMAWIDAAGRIGRASLSQK